MRLSLSISNISKKDFMKKVKLAKEYIKKGDIIQTVLSQRLSLKYSKDKDAFSIYRYLRVLNPSPYMYYLNFKDFLVFLLHVKKLLSFNKIFLIP